MTAHSQPGIQAPLSPTQWKPTYESFSVRFVVKIDGNPYIAESFEATWNAHGATDEATVVMPIGGASNLPTVKRGGKAILYPDWTQSINRTEKNAGTPVVIEIWAGQPANLSTFSTKNLSGLTLRFRGIVDVYSVQFRDNKTTFTCRSLAYPLTSNKITMPFPREDSVTTVAFIQQQCARFGLKMAPPNLAANPVLMIDVMGGEFISGVKDWFIWDLILQCAQIDDVDVWVDRTGTLHYEAASLVTRASIPFVWGQDCKGIDGTHSPQFSKNVRVNVHSYTKRTKTSSITRVSTNSSGGIDISSYTRQVSATPIFGTTSSIITSIGKNGTVTTTEGTSSGGSANGGTGSEGESNLEKYTYFVANKTLAQCQAMAQQIWRQISMHEYALKVYAPVTLSRLKQMDVTALLKISGLPMRYFNSSYSSGPGQPPTGGGFWPRQITERLSPKSGWHWEIDCVNHTPPQGAV